MAISFKVVGVIMTLAAVIVPVVAMLATHPNSIALPKAFVKTFVANLIQRASVMRQHMPKWLLYAGESIQSVAHLNNPHKILHLITTLQQGLGQAGKFFETTQTVTAQIQGLLSGLVGEAAAAATIGYLYIAIGFICLALLFCVITIMYWVYRFFVKVVIGPTILLLNLVFRLLKWSLRWR